MEAEENFGTAPRDARLAEVQFFVAQAAKYLPPRAVHTSIDVHYDDGHRVLVEMELQKKTFVLVVIDPPDEGGE